MIGDYLQKSRRRFDYIHNLLLTSHCHTGMRYGYKFSRSKSVKKKPLLCLGCTSRMYAQ